MALAVGVRLLPAIAAEPIQSPDSASYLAPARALAAGKGYRDGDDPVGGRPPAYPAFLGLGLTLSGGSLRAVGVAQALLGGAALLALWPALTALLGPRAALGGAALFALDPLAVAQGAFVLREVLLLVGVAAVAGLTGGRPRRWRLFALGPLLGLLVLTHQLYLLLGPFLAAVDLAGTSPRRRPRRAALWLGVAVLALLPPLLWARRNERLTGRLSFSNATNPVPARELWLTTACPNRWLSGDPATGFQALAWDEERRLLAERGLEGARAELYRRAWANWREHPLRSLGRTALQNLWYWLEVPGAVLLVEHPRLYLLRWLLLPFHWVRLTAAAAGLLWLLRSGAWRRHPAPVAVLAFFALAPALLYPVPRYLGPAAPVLDLLAALGLARFGLRGRGEAEA